MLFPNVVFATSDVSLGDIYNPVDGNVSSVGVSVVASDGNVDVMKKVDKVSDEGEYNVSFWVRGKKSSSAKIKGVYVVFVIDRSYTMRLNNRWVDARDAVINISSELSKSGIEMALVGFSGGKSSQSVFWDDVITMRGFDSSAFTLNEFGNYDDDYIHGGGTNIQGGLLKASELLNDKQGSKYVVLLTDGVPTFYYDSLGNTLGPGNSNTDSKLSEVPNCVNETIKAANELKKSATVYAIGYDYDNLYYNFTYNGVNYDERSLAFDTLTGVSSAGKYYQASTSNNNTIANELKKIQLELSYFPAGKNPSVVDGIGNSFRISSNDDYGGSKTLNTNGDFIIEEEYKKIGDFNVFIDSLVDTGWYPVNADFKLTYQDFNLDSHTINCDNNPMVYWENKYNYVVNYYKDSIDSSNYLGGYREEVDNGVIIDKDFIDFNKYIPLGYYLDGMYNSDGLSIDSLGIDKNNNNVINVVYKIKKYDFKVNYYYADLNNNYGSPFFSKTISNISYDTSVNTSSYYLEPSKIKKGYSLDEINTKDRTYKITKDGIEIDIYYKYAQVKANFNFFDDILPPQTGIIVNKTGFSFIYILFIAGFVMLGRNIILKKNK